MKACTYRKCSLKGVLQEDVEFGLTKHGLPSSVCNTCKEMAKQYEVEKRREANKRWRETHRDRVNEYAKKQREKNRDKINTQQRMRRQREKLENFHHHVCRCNVCDRTFDRV